MNRTHYALITTITDRPGKLPRAHALIRTARETDVAGEHEGKHNTTYTEIYPSKRAAIQAHREQDDGDPSNTLTVED